MNAEVMRMKRIVILTLMILVVITASLTAFAVPTGNNAEEVFSVNNSDGLYLIGFSGGDVHLERLVPSVFSVDLHRSYPVAAASVFGDTAVILCNDTPNEQLIVYTYDLSAGMWDSFAIPNCRISYNRSFSYDGYSLYLRDDDDLSAVVRYSTAGQIVSRYDFGSADARIIRGYSSGFFVLADGALYRNSGDSYNQLSGAVIHTPAVMIAEGILADSRGGIYRIEGGISLIGTVETDGSCTVVIAPDGTLYASVGKTICRYDAETGQKDAYYDVSSPVDALRFSSGYLYAILDGASSEAVRISPDAFIPFPQKGNSSSSLLPISSDVYRVDTANYRITRIPSPTTFAQFKRNMHDDGYQAQLFRDAKELKSGSVGTAMTVVFSAGNSYTFELSVIGDITGEGNVNSRDVGELMDDFLGNLSFDGVYTDAADVSDDGTVDLLDLAMLCRLAK